MVKGRANDTVKGRANDTVKGRANDMVKGKHIPPSRERYQESHPVVSIRVSRELYDELQAIKKKGKRSFADILKEGLGMEKATTERGYQVGYAKGYAEAKKRFCITYPCSVCHKPIELNSEPEKEAARQAMVNAKWGHTACIEGKQP